MAPVAISVVVVMTVLHISHLSFSRRTWNDLDACERASDRTLLSIFFLFQLRVNKRHYLGASNVATISTPAMCTIRFNDTNRRRDVCQASQRLNSSTDFTTSISQTSHVSQSISSPSSPHLLLRRLRNRSRHDSRKRRHTRRRPRNRSFRRSLCNQARASARNPLGPAESQADVDTTG